MHVIGKAVASIESSDDDKFGPNGGFTAILTNASLDRDGDSLELDGWMPLQESYPLDMDHEMNVAGTIGSYHPYVQDGEIWMDATFSSIPRAQEVRTLVKEGHIRSVSVAFMTDKTKKDGEPRREMLNAGIVAIPSNRDAIIQFAKGLLPEEEKPKGIKVNVVPQIDHKALEKVTADLKAALSGGGGDSGALVQAIHDAAVHLGAVCIQVMPEPDADDSSGGKSVSFTNQAGQVVAFESHDAAREFFTDMLKSIEDADQEGVTLVEAGHTPDVKSQTLELEVPDDLDLEQFKAALQEVLNPKPQTEESPAKPPAEAAADEAPADDAADDAADEPEVDPEETAKITADEMLMGLFAAANS